MKREFTLKDIDDVAVELLNHVSGNVLCFYGEMGAGKTTLIKHLVKNLNGIDSANSPTFGMVNEYFSKKNELLGYHFDFYRIEDESEIYDLGFEDYLSSDAWLFIEWPEKVSSVLPDNTEFIYLQFIDENTRSIEINP
ncbi:tRNA (adenosine(37)-N6)-threonylcarbamoyltransferase complex ATPase subunit type 1 TsaE [Flagellimonas meridianipacifica]|uniref:tRNA threonylcarbamoyladenosine biosynthesis protein TsaE n=1 Tax=Flagellimonas meridianipacifica TaxID=1080225 RepID=A0A2T0MC31_9FLAO|nr:tRNA (adenosine(37)-N6)-threonylcarbamoyltransferase complex ATPase subunit type 1 TsaE [Allomuricauda pacifica]PRX55064.1 tRNA threonylcarbamoyladenosine biosynthesis protein TsaE [Allomuricauda pacifica]